ncbi:hypothetical protein TL16_g02044 [Triparma laevis f. inornata]|uniref:Glutaredoxin domain-containing protein n=1 Tax=Triparma laevis f. inornata TaxID=1714386 RepID=A0A9W7DTT5_9STRA|nr:hypothetical protein TL16_g02044 [Triparma laevis f. inornata]
MVATLVAVQATVLGVIGEIIGSPFRFNSDDVRADLKDEIKKNKAIIYTYAWSPFSTSALDALKNYDVTVIELGFEWFLMGPTESETRVALQEITGSTALPKLFVNGQYQGGYSTDGPSGNGIVGLQKNGQLDKILKKKVVKRGKMGKR